MISRVPFISHRLQCYDCITCCHLDLYQKFSGNEDLGKERRKGCGKACRSSGRRWHLSFGSEESVRKGTFKRTTGRLDFGMTWPGNKQTTVGNGYVSKNGRMRNPRRGAQIRELCLAQKVKKEDITGRKEFIGCSWIRFKCKRQNFVELVS